jgi:hypothetical protein
MTHNLHLEDLIQEAIAKINGKNERDLCNFLPVSRGYMHHFTFKKMSQDAPQQLFDLIKKYIIDPKKPNKIELRIIDFPEQPRKKMKQFIISEDELNRILNVAKQAQDFDLIEKLKLKQGSPFYPNDDD